MTTQKNIAPQMVLMVGLLGLSLANAMEDPFMPPISLNPQDYIITNQFVVMQKPGRVGMAHIADKTVMSALTGLSETLGVGVEGAPQPLALPGAMLVTLEKTGVQVSAQTFEDVLPAGMQAIPVLRAYPAAVEKDLDPTKEPLYSKQAWHYEQIKLLDAWKYTKGREDIVIAVLDTGVLFDHPDLKGQLLPGYDFVSNPYTGNDGGGRDPDPTDPGDGITQQDIKEGQARGRTRKSTWHGTHVAGTIGAALNGLGVLGVAPHAKILPLRVLGRGGGTSVDIMEALLYAAGYPVPGVGTIPKEHKAHVASLSLGGSSMCQADFQEAVKKVLEAGVIVVVAAGNNNINAEKFYPANCPGVISIAASNPEGGRASYSNFGEIVTLTAPGGQMKSVWDKTRAVFSTYNAGDSDGVRVGEHSYDYLQGTSMATPHVSGVIGLMLSAIPKNKTLSPIQIKDILVKTTKAFPVIQSAEEACNREKCGAGILDAEAAVKATIREAGEGVPAL